MYRLFTTPLLVFCLSLLVACEAVDETRNRLLDKATAFVPVTVDEAVGEQAMEQLRQRFRFVENQLLKKEIEALAKPLVEAVPGDYPGEINIHVIDNPMVNAFALPGGDIILPTGFLLFVQSAEEVRGVLAHEIAHVVQRHSMQGLMTRVGISLALQATLGDASEIVQAIAIQGANLLALKHSRDDEREADAVGVALLQEAGLDPSGLAQFFKRLQATKGVAAGDGIVGSLEEMLSTHPLTEERVDRLAGISPVKVQKAGISKARFDRFQSIVRQVQTTQ